MGPCSGFFCFPFLLWFSVMLCCSFFFGFPFFGFLSLCAEKTVFAFQS